MLAVATVLGLLVAGAGAGAAEAAVGESTLTDQHVAGKLSAAQERRIKAAVTEMPLRFVENQGQVPGEADYYLHGSRTSVAFTETGLTYGLSKKDKRWGLKLDFVGAKPTEPVAEAPGAGRVSYFKGSSGEWRKGLKTYGRLVYHDLWPGIDLVYSGTGSELKYEFRVEPGADPSHIRMSWRGASDVRIERSGALRVDTGVGPLTDKAPVSYQPGAGAERRRSEVKSAFQLTKVKGKGKVEGKGATTYGFELGAYDKTRALVIDPATLVYAGFVGGAGDDEAADIAVDGTSAAYITGLTTSIESGFPVAVGPDVIHNGDFDAFVVKVKPDGTDLVYAGYIGGAGFDAGIGIAVDGSGAAYVAGDTRSDESGFPVTGGPDLTYNGGSDDAFVAKVAPDGAALVYAGYIGGAAGEFVKGLAVDGTGAAYVTGETRSDESTFPVTGGPDVTLHSGGPDTFIAKVAPLGSGLVYAGYIGGSGAEFGGGVAVDATGAAYVTGETSSDESTFPVKVGPDLTHNGGIDVFVAKVAPDGLSLVHAGYIGGAGTDTPFGIAVDPTGAASVAGRTDSPESGFPVKVGPDLTYNGDTADAFVAKVAPGGGSLAYAGYIGGAGSDQALDIAVDSLGAAYVIGDTSSSESTFPVKDGPDPTFGGASAYVAKVAPDGSELIYAGYLDNADQGTGIAADSAGAAYAAGFTSSASFPATVGPDLTHNGDRDAFVVKVSPVPIRSDLSVVKSDSRSDPVVAGQSVTYTLAVTNNGPTNAYGVTLTDTLPAGLDFTSAGAGCAETAPGSNVVTCHIGAVAVDTARTRTITAATTAPGTFSNTVTVTGSVEDPDPVNNTATETTTVTPSGGQAPLCFGLPATITGTAGNDRINGTAGPDVIAAGEGDDDVNGLGGDDRICGGNGNDQLTGSGGNDQLAGDGGDDTLLGGLGNDTLDGGPGTNVNDGGIGTDACTNPSTGRGCP
ncbi:hypothetical protein OG625_38470 [Streptomyces sp. NBC_01351]|uniref:DUF7948 domain-containing protein n=1 Tax=Streptomyces sp. NBC_01351 TaxID=2903833 RepID=UPI002E3700EC|nr:hypothetical protein [Streptomyces sp. NBC_01351]